MTPVALGDPEQAQPYLVGVVIVGIEPGAHKVDVGDIAEGGLPIHAPEPSADSHVDAAELRPLAPLDQEVEDDLQLASGAVR